MLELYPRECKRVEGRRNWINLCGDMDEIEQNSGVLERPSPSIERLQIMMICTIYLYNINK